PRHPNSRVSLPHQYALAPRVQQAEREDRDEDGHLDHRGEALPQVDDGPGEEEDGLDREQQIEVRVEVVADVHLGPAATDRIEPAFVSVELARPVRRVRRAQQTVGPEGDDEEDHGHGDQQTEGRVRAEAATHARRITPGATQWAWQTGP